MPAKPGLGFHRESEADPEHWHDDAQPHDPEAWRKVHPFNPRLHDPILFVPATASPSTSPPPPAESSGSAVAARYLSIVGLSPSTAREETRRQRQQLCTTCNLPLTPAHETTLAHQSRMPHSHPPHALPRSSVGLRILEASGWDPDARVGLGKAGTEGTRYPVKAVEKRDRIGVGGGRVRRVGGQGRGKKLGAREARRREEGGRRVRQRLRGELEGRDWGVLTGEGKEAGTGLR